MSTSVEKEVGVSTFTYKAGGFIRQVFLLVKRKLTRWRRKLWPYSLVIFEAKLPPEFIVTEHAKRRILERMPISDRKIKKLAVKAYYSEEPIPYGFKYKKKFLKYKYQGGYKSCYRAFMGLVFVYIRKYNKNLGQAQKILVTAYPLKNKWKKHGRS